MSKRTTPRKYRLIGADSRGQSAMEVLLSLPFLLLVMLIGVNFGKAFLLKQKAVAAARFAAWQQVHNGRAVSSNDLQQSGYGENQMKLTALSGGGSGPSGLQDISSVGSLATGVVALISRCPNGDTAYRVSYNCAPMGRFLKEAEIS